MSTFGCVLNGWEEARMRSLVRVTPDHVAFAKGNKASAFIWMRPADFLTLTLPVGYAKLTLPFSPREELMAEAEEFDVERAAKEYQTPFLQVEMGTGRVVGHEGRHRAAGLIKSSYAGKMPVAIILKAEGYSRRGSLDDVPAMLRAQDFGSQFVSSLKTVSVDKTDALDLAVSRS